MQKPIPASLPLTPGIYIYKNTKGRIIYVGKAKVLRKRILSYFRKDGLTEKTKAMLKQAESLETICTTTEKEALLLEASLIKKHRPHYNIDLRDDKQYILFKISSKHPYPRLEIIRHTQKNLKDKARYYGPFTSALAARNAWKTIHNAFPLRRCTDRAMKNRVRPCLYYYINQCPAPCMDYISPSEYNINLQKVCELLSGKSQELMQSLEKDMLLASDTLDFEKAALLRDQIQAIKRTVEKQSVVIPKNIDMDIIGLATVEKGLCLGILFVRNGMLMDGQNFFWHGLDFEDTPELLLSFLAQFYGPLSPPPTIILPWIPDQFKMTFNDNENYILNDIEQGDKYKEDNWQEDSYMFQALTQSLSDLRQGTVKVIAPRNTTENSLVDMASSNAKEEGRKYKEKPITERLAIALHLNLPPTRIECVDVSHTGGKQTRVGMVVFEHGKALKSAYRQYIMPDGSSDDYATLAAWVIRRIESGAPWPDLLLIDGGKGQLSAVERSLKEQGKEGLFALAAIAKARDEMGHADRRAGNIQDRIFLPNRSNPLPLKAGSPELLFLQHIRDCTHRFAIGRHRQARTNAALEGELLRIPGIGKYTARLLWDRFKNTEDMAMASEEELASIKGIGKKRAKDLWLKLQNLRQPHAP